MTSQSPRIYLYKITFEEVQYYYYGVHKEKVFGEQYWGSPYTHKWCWEFYTPKKQILQLFDFTDEGWLEAQKVEKRLIQPVFNTDKWCLNENCGGVLSLKVIRENGKKTGNKAKELGMGIFGLTIEQRSETGKKSGKIGGNRAKELGVGVHARTKEQIIEDATKGGNKSKELGLGVHGRTKKQMDEDARKGGNKAKELGLGIHARTPEKMSENGKMAAKLCLGFHRLSKKERQEIVAKTNSQKWMCLETGYITTSGPLTAYQRARGIDTSKRKRIL